MNNSPESRINFQLKPGGSLNGELRLPSDKSISHRALIFNAIAEGRARITNILEGEDVIATLKAFQKMGVNIDGPVDGEVIINGVGLYGLRAPKDEIYLGNSGTAMRLLTGLLSGQKFSCKLTGDASLSRRPMQRVVDPLRSMGAHLSTEDGGTPPIHINGMSRLMGVRYTLPVASAQVKSAILLAGLYADGSTEIIEPSVTRDHTERMLGVFGYGIERQGHTIRLSNGIQHQAHDIDVPVDLSSAAFFLVGASIAKNSRLRLLDVGINPTRTGILQILRKMGADIEITNERPVSGEPVADLVIKSALLKAVTIGSEEVALAIDEIPILAVAAACAEGRSEFRGAQELRHKESDRIKAIVVGLRRLGIRVEELPDGMIIEGGAIRGGEVTSFTDHRIAMAFCMAALASDSEILVRDCVNVATSFPGFVDLVKLAGLSICVQSSLGPG